VVFVNDYIDRWLEKAETGACLPGTFPRHHEIWAKPKPKHNEEWVNPTDATHANDKAGWDDDGNGGPELEALFEEIFGEGTLRTREHYFETIGDGATSPVATGPVKEPPIGTCTAPH
jgi:hypothetical protein